MTIKTPKAASPLGLLQEKLERGSLYGWRLLVCCACLDRVTGKRAAPVVEKVLARWPAPDDLAVADDVELVEALRPLGMQKARAKHVKKLSQVWRDGDWADPSDLPGVGAYALASWRIFVDGELPDEEPKDGWLAAYWRWAVHVQTIAGKKYHARRNRTTAAPLSDGYVPRLDGKRRSCDVVAPDVVAGDAVLSCGQAQYLTRISTDRLHRELRAGRMRGRYVGGPTGWVTTFRAVHDWCEGKDAGMPPRRKKVDKIRRGADGRLLPWKDELPDPDEAPTDGGS